MQLGELATLVGGALYNGDATTEVRGIQTLRDADESEISFLANLRYKHEFTESRAAAILIDKTIFPETTRPVIRVPDPYLAFAKLQNHLHPQTSASGQRHPTAVIADSATLAADVDVGPMAVVGAETTIGAGSRIGAGVVIGQGVTIGCHCLFHPRAVVADGCRIGNGVILQPGAVIGSDGFGYAWDGTKHLKIPQIGRVVLEDDVEIGANTTIDRGALGDTVIGRGVKLDNQVQIGHNVKLGPYTVIVSQAGVSGSTTLGVGCQVAGQVGIAGHLTIGDRCRIAGKSGVTHDLAADGEYGGFPAVPMRIWRRASLIYNRLPDMWKRLNLSESRDEKS